MKPIFTHPHRQKPVPCVTVPMPVPDRGCVLCHRALNPQLKPSVPQHLPWCGFLGSRIISCCSSSHQRAQSSITVSLLLPGLPQPSWEPSTACCLLSSCSFLQLHKLLELQGAGLSLGWTAPSPTNKQTNQQTNSKAQQSSQGLPAAQGF